MTTTADCVLGLAVPLTEAAWLSDLAAGPDREYARFYCAGRASAGAAPSEVWRKLYEPFEARPIGQIVEEARRAGVEVIGACTLRELAAAIHRHSVIVLVAHWRSGMLHPGDVADRTGFLWRLAEDKKGPLAALRSALSVEWRSRLERLDEREMENAEFEQLLSALNHSLGEKDLSSTPRPNELASPRAFNLAVNRATLNASCPAELDPTTGLELADGTYPADVVAQVFPSHFAGLVDLTVCFSVVLAEQIKRGAPLCRIMANREMTAPANRLRIFQQTIRLVAERQADYLEVNMEIRKHLQR